MRICIVGDSRDLTSIYVAWVAQRRGIEVLELSEETLGTDWFFAFDDAERGAGRIATTGATYHFSALSGAFARLNPQPAVPPELNLPPQERGLLTAERRGSIQQLLNYMPCPVANRPYSGRSNGSKPYQMRLLAEAGFAVPRWIVSNEKDTVREFARACGTGAIYKSCSGLRSRVRFLDEQVLRRLSEGTSPIVVQEYIKGRDVRIHTVARRAFATEVISSGVDHRFEDGGNEFSPARAPTLIEERCCEVGESEGLIIAGFDFRVTEDDRWYCLEMNPVPTFLPYEMAASQPIADAVIDTLIQHSSREPKRTEIMAESSSRQQT
jgi:hypothetical protein